MLDLPYNIGMSTNIVKIRTFDNLYTPLTTQSVQLNLEFTTLRISSQHGEDNGGRLCIFSVTTRVSCLVRFKLVLKTTKSITQK